MRKEGERALTEGLQAGYIGDAKKGETRRGGFSLQSIKHSTALINYIDEWITGERTGGGQEIAEFTTETDEEMATRLYAGGTIAENKLAKIGLTPDDVIRRLKGFLLRLGERTRLDQDCSIIDGFWQYSYTVIKQIPEIPLTMSLETIDYKGDLVFVHGILRTAVE